MGTVPPGNYDGLDALADASAGTVAPVAPPTEPFVSQTQMPLLTWNPQGYNGITMPGAYITSNDELAFFVCNSNANITNLTATVRIMNPDGTIQTIQFVLHNVPSDRSSFGNYFPLQEGMLLAVTIHQPALVNSRGQTFVNFYIVRNLGGSVPFTQMLIADYLTTSFQPSWPGGLLKAPTDGRGFVTAYAGAAPPMGVVPTLTQATATIWRLVAVTTTLQTSAVVGNRQVYLRVTGGSTGDWHFPAQAVVPANTLATFNWGAGMPLEPTLAQNQGAALPNDFLISGSPLIEAQVIGGDAGDLWQPLSVSVEEWINV